MIRNIKGILLGILVMGMMVFVACGNNKNNDVDITNTENIKNTQNAQSTEIVQNTQSAQMNEADTEQPGIEELLETEWKDKYVPELNEKFESYLDGYDGYLALISVDGDTMRISSSNYDGDAKDNFIVKEVKIAENVTYSELTIYTVINDKGETSTDTYVELTSEDMEAILDSTLGIGFVWFNDDMEIEKIMFYGALTNWE